jgi:hypothetical protein
VKVSSLKLAQAVEGVDLFPSKPAVLAEYAQQFLAWLNNARLEEKTKTYYRNGWRLLRPTTIADKRLDHITSDGIETLGFPGSSSNANCALRTLRRMLHKAEEGKMIGRAPKIKLMKEHGRSLRLDDEAAVADLPGDELVEAGGTSFARKILKPGPLSAQELGPACGMWCSPFPKSLFPGLVSNTA